MTPEYMTIVALLALEAATIAILWDTHRQYSWFRKAWMRDSAELLDWKRNALMRDKRTGRYHKKGDS